MTFTADFELDANHFSGDSGPTISRTTTTTHRGNGALQIAHSSDIYSSTSCAITRGITPGARIAVSGYVKGPNHGIDIRLIIHFFAANRTYISNIFTSVSPNGSWQPLAISGTATQQRQNRQAGHR